MAKWTVIKTGSIDGRKVPRDGTGKGISPDKEAGVLEVDIMNTNTFTLEIEADTSSAALEIAVAHLVDYYGYEHYKLIDWSETHITRQS